MNKLILISFLAACLVALAQADERPRFTIEASQKRGGGERHETFKVSQDAWRSKNGQWSAGGYVQHDRHKFQGGKTKDTHGGFQITGRF